MEEYGAGYAPAFFRKSSLEVPARNRIYVEDIGRSLQQGGKRQATTPTSCPGRLTARAARQDRGTELTVTRSGDLNTEIPFVGAVNL